MILVCGEALIDLVPVAVDTEVLYAPRTGGSPYNVAVGLARLGASVGLFGRLSTDPFGVLLRGRLVADGVDGRLLVTGSEPTAVAVVHLVPGEEPQFVFYGDGAADCMLTPDAMPSEATLEGVHALHFGSISLVREPGAAIYAELMEREHGRRVLSLDPNIRPGLIGDRDAYRARLERLVALASIVKVSRADLAWLYPGRPAADVAAAWLTSGPALVVLTKGDEGAIGMTPEVVVDAPALPVAVRDTVGAGDTFTGGLLGSLDRRGLLEPEQLRNLTREEIKACLVFANQAAAVTCTRSGAEPPTLAEVRAVVAQEDG